jgi:4-amino-4-deoxy-L-arabinose transferase-like glycosyltransferase
MLRRRFGRAGGFVGGLVLALTPITVAVSRHNNPDALLVLLCTAALWFTVRAFEDGRTRWIVWAGVMVGLAFETKMLVALVVVPGIVAAWLWVAPRGRLAAARQLLLGGAAMVVVGGAWPLLMTLTPASDRPWISGTSDNSIWSLIFGYNGLGRVDGQQGGPAGGGPGGGGFFGGSTGVFRLLNSAMGGQAGWLLGVAAVGCLGVVVASRLRRADARTGWAIAVGGAFFTTAIVFSFAKGIFHPYYVSLLAPFAAALVGATMAYLISDAGAARIVGPLALLAGMVTELAVLKQYPGELDWLKPLLIAGAIVAGAALAFGIGSHWRALVLSAATFLLLLAPATWASDTLGHATSGTFPAGGPEQVAGGRMAGGRFGSTPLGGEASSLSSVVRYVSSHGGGTIGVDSQSGAAASIIESGANVAGLGGFSGRESQVSVRWLAEAVQSGRIRWVLVSSTGGGFQDGRIGASELMAAVQKAGTKVLATNGGTLYDLSGEAAALLAS